MEGEARLPGNMGLGILAFIMGVVVFSFSQWRQAYLYSICLTSITWAGIIFSSCLISAPIL